jgi:aerobic-type carbon monoxide dehydrogenase small subunit (CoxS/CutS family)
MSEREELDKSLDAKVEGCGLSRREFLKNAGFVIGGASLGSMAFLNACNNGGTKTVTTTVGGAGSTVTTTVTAPATGTTGATNVATPGAANVVHFIINNVDYYGSVEPQWTLLYVMREKLGLIATKKGCDHGDCGVCALIMDGRIVESCLILAVEADGKKIETLEGITATTGAKLTTLQRAFVDEDAMQCGFCTAGMIMTAKALLAFKPKPTVAEIKEFMAGTICRCGAYIQIINAIKKTAGV